MVMVTDAIPPLNNGNIDLKKWLTELRQRFTAEEINSIRQACSLVQNDCDHLQTPLKTNYISYSLEIANLIFSLDFDYETVIASILYPALQYSDLTIDDIGEQFSATINKLLGGVLQIDVFNSVQSRQVTNHHIDNYRRMLLAMVDDIRIVPLKLAERTVLLRHVNILPLEQQRYISQQAIHIYAPLANRLGVLELKQELEDTAFRILQPIEYKAIVKQLNEHHIDREHFIKQFIVWLKKLLQTAKISAEIKGRTKHIHSIYHKMQSKALNYYKIYDIMAIRILVDNIKDCYTALSIVHSQWQHIAEEFNDYITTPKTNGYRSIHTVIISTEGKPVEIQIRTQQMHAENELGVAAHWVYKEGEQEDIYRQKIAWLRQLLDWEREIAHSSTTPTGITQGIDENRIYVFAADGAVISLPKGATPLDFAYYIHSEIGHKCRGAKVDERIVPLTEALMTGNKVEILTAKEAKPSRDWLNPQLGYLVSARAKAKIRGWFKKRDYQQNLNNGAAILQRELKRFNLTNINANALAERFYLNSGNDVLAAIGNGDIRMPQLTGTLQDLLHQQNSNETKSITIAKSKRPSYSPKGILVDGISNLLTSIAYCCKPLPGEAIIGYTTLGRGITIHSAECANIIYSQQQYPERIVKVSWGDVSKNSYTIDLLLEAYNRNDLLRDITHVISDENVTIIGLNSYNDKHNCIVIVNFSIEIGGQEQWLRLQRRLQAVENVISLRR